MSDLSTGTIFGESPAIHAKLDAFFSIIAELAARDASFIETVSVNGTPNLAELLGSSASREPVIRRALETYMQGLRAHNPETGRLLGDITEGVRIPPDSASLDADGRFSVIPVLPGHAMRALVTIDPADPWTHRLQDLFDDAFGATEARCELVPARPDDVAALGAAIERVVAVEPALAAATLTHNSVIGIVEGQGAFESASNATIPHAIFVNREALDDTMRAAEIVLHECVHQKLYDLYLLYALLPVGYSTDTASRLTPPWQKEQWPYDRAFAAAHVYVHIAAFYDAAGDSFGPTGSSADRRQLAVTRAEYLLSALAQAPEGAKSPSGREFLSWLAANLS